MTRNARPRTRTATDGRAPYGVAGGLAGTALGSAGLVTVLLATAAGSTHPLGAPGYWAWVLTGLQVASLWAAGAGRAWGWPTGAAVQPAWIAYALVTGQVGFVPGCVVSGTVQTVNFVRAARRRHDPGRAVPASGDAGRRSTSTALRVLARFDA